MKDRIHLLLAATAMSGLGWSFWHFGGENAASILMSVLVVLLTIDNFLLRRQVRKSKE